MRQDGARLLGVAVHLRDQRRQIGEFHFVAQLGDEFDFDAAPVQVAVEIEQVRFEQAARRRPPSGRVPRLDTDGQRLRSPTPCTQVA